MRLYFQVNYQLSPVVTLLWLIPKMNTQQELTLIIMTLASAGQERSFGRLEGKSIGCFEIAQSWHGKRSGKRDLYESNKKTWTRNLILETTFCIMIVGTEQTYANVATWCPFIIAKGEKAVKRSMQETRSRLRFQQE